MASIDEMKVAQMVKLSQSLLKSLRDGNQYNDVKIVLHDGELEASKFVLSSRSEYFYKMFDKSHEFQENHQRDVKVSCKKVVMEKILTYLYGGEMSIDGLSLIDAVELLDMLRLMVLEDAFNLAEKELMEKIENESFTIGVCLNTIPLVFSTKLRRTFFGLMDFIWSNLETVLEEHDEDIQHLSPDILKSYVRDEELQPNYGRTNKQFIYGLKFFFKWYEIHHDIIPVSASMFKTVLKDEIRLVDLTTFEVEDLLGCVKKSKLFKDEDIDAAILEIHERERCYHYYD